MPTVVKGDTVRRGELIASKPENGIGANIFSSVSGTVVSVDEKSIIVSESDTDFSQYETLKSETSNKLVEESGIVGLGGAGFPTYVKLSTKLSEQGMLIINAAECEPILSHNISRIEESPSLLIEGAVIAADILSVVHIVIGIKSIHRTAAESLKKAIEFFNSTDSGKHKIEIKLLDDIYPMGEERALIREIKNVILPPGALPSDADAVVMNAETVYRIYEAVKLKKPFIDKDLTVAGKLGKNADIRVLKDVPLGKSVEDVIETAGGLGNDYGELIMGGPFTGKRTMLSSPIVKTTGGLIAAEEFIGFPDNIGILVCACGADEERLREIAYSMKSTVVGVEYCKQAHKTGCAYKCENPGHCPGQAGKIIALKRAGAKAVLVSNCTDCTNTVMSCAPNLGLKVFHCTDGALRSVNHKLIRRMK